MHLHDLIKKIPFKGQADTRDIKAIIYDSRKVTPGSLFIAIHGEKHDGKVFISQAIQNGATAILSKNGEPINSIPFIHVRNPRQAMSKISAQFYGNPSKKMQIIGVTGTNGKTSITQILYQILSRLNKNCGALGTLGFQTPSGMLSSNFTTPESVELQQMLNTLLMAGVKNVIMEVSSHALSQFRVNDVDFNIAIFSNLSQDHLDFHKNMKSYFNSKLKLFSMLKSSGVAIINIDDPYSKKIISTTKAKIFSFGITTKAMLHPIKIEYNSNGMNVVLNYKKKKIHIKTNLFGEYNLYNIMAAISVCINRDINMKDIEMAFNHPIIIPGRLEEIPSNFPGKVYLDYAHTPDACEKVLSMISKLYNANYELNVIFGCGGNRDKDKRHKIAKITERYAKSIIVTTDNPRSEPLENIIDDIRKGFKANTHQIILDRKKAIHKALNQMHEKSILLILGKGHENYQETKFGKIPHNDKEIIENYINES
ncbi:MAG: UDP-N-acetylmuramoyl-L-alanyl-D-glutamate--2,6-diaminopimelate ligase [Candidatus Neomarinimicrobiota bacterium]|nr:UDP-N-acetylmuramoyl-L-alanyl-D-glutamate--2,6-diaminopimelate ligase [Candidatus Neomarinimicrobiota bacterium]